MTMLLVRHVIVLSILAAHSTVFAREVRARFLAPDAITQKLTSGYLSNEDLASYLTDFVKRCGDIAKLSSFGKSAGGTPLLSLEISDTPGVDSAKPQVKYVGNIHGDEPSGRQLLLLLAERVCADYKTNGSVAQQLIKFVRLVIVPTMNPDGFAAQRRENKNLKDLNRNFPDPILNKGKDLRQPVGGEQPETLAMMNFTLSHRFVASLAIHEGALVANYPFDGYPDGSQQIRKEINPSPDDSAFRFMATTYSNLHTTMHNSAEFPGGITNGAQWYPLYGGMQDWNYLAANCMEVTLELNDQKTPPPARLAAMWTENQNALLNWPLKTVMAGLRGIVKGLGSDGQTQPLPATISIVGISHNTTASAQFGDFYRVLAPGSYVVVVLADGYQSASFPIQVPMDGSGVQVSWTLLKVGVTAPPPGTTSRQPKQGHSTHAGEEDLAKPSVVPTDDGEWVVVGEQPGPTGTTWLGASGGTLTVVALFAVPVMLLAVYVVYSRRQGGAGLLGYMQLSQTTFPRPPTMLSRAKGPTLEP